ncbi:conserved protein of unknown function [Micropruina glycogenica]|uniref:RNA polymerase sigma-70 region 2 domain-containing protein n=1 Tax=Micropruina glycogenica TaxID=75385 RepID=A0A2N9JDP6_9ACTN|nr:conserved protein of unknown function [Micropruina glycogenica]
MALQQFAYLMIGNRDDARDAVQGAMVGAFRTWSAVRRSGNPTGYVRRSIVNANVSRWRKRRREVVVAEVREPSPTRDDPLIDSLYLRRLTDALPHRRRAALVLRYWQGCRCAERANTACHQVRASARRRVQAWAAHH